MIEKVLLVDDEADFVQTLSERMKNRGMRVDITTSGAEAIKKVKEQDFDVIVLDLSMPEMDGIETLKELMNQKSDVEVIFLTGHATLEKGIEAIKLGAFDFMEKPVDLVKLTEKIREAKSRKMVIVGKKVEEQIKDILSRKAW